VTIIGGSVAGLSLGLLLARRGIPATIIERDPATMGPDAEAAGAAPRRATPQARHSHAFLARARAILRDELPATYDALLEAGVREAPLPYEGPGATPATDDDVVVINARRSVFEWVLRRAAEAEPLVDLRLGAAADGIVLAGADTTVRGLVVDGDELAADVIVDASGKRSPVAGWLGAHHDDGFDIVPCGISYISRFYRLLDGEPTALNRGFTHGASFDRYSCLVFPADNGTFSVTFGVLPEDRAMRALLDGAGFDAAAAAIDGIAPWVDPASAIPLDDPSLMAGLANRYHDRPGTGPPRGLLRVGDALCVTNPAHTRGTTLAMVGAQHLADAIASHGADGDALAGSLDDLDHDELAPWFADSVEQDAVRLQRWRPDEAPERSPGPRHRLSNGETYVAASADPVVWRAFTRLQSSLLLPAAVLDDPEIERRVRAVQATGHALAGLAAPDHDGLVDVARAAGDRPPRRAITV
jgi:2-polyprenyl-6-methoxyphenol hydroxylase-like FAD-dependent oxidoreductase